MFKLAQAVVEIVDEFKEAPSGVIFAAMNGAGIDINTYNSIIAHLIHEKVLKLSNHLLAMDNRDRAVELRYLVEV